MLKPPGSGVESEVIAAIVGWLIMLAADLVISKMAQKQRSDPAMGENCDVAAASN